MCINLIRITYSANPVHERAEVRAGQRKKGRGGRWGGGEGVTGGAR